MEEENAKLLQMRLIIGNNRLKKEIKNKGYSQMEVSKLLHLRANTLSRIINLHAIPTEDQQIAIACLLEKPIDYLFPEILTEKIKLNAFKNRTRLFDEEQVRQIAGPPLLITDGGISETEEKVNNELLAQAFNKVLSTLTKREQRVIEALFGLNGQNPRTPEQVGYELNVTGSRIWQIEAKSLRKLRRPRRAGLLKTFMPLSHKARKVCERCGKFIEPQRLQKHPTAHLCEKCKPL